MWRRGVEVGVALAVGALGGTAWHVVDHRSSLDDASVQVAGIATTRSAFEGAAPGSAVLEAASAAVWSVEASGCGRRRQASATVVRVPGAGVFAVTNAHVVQGAGPVRLFAPDGTSSTATARGALQGRDLALLVIDAGGTNDRGDSPGAGADAVLETGPAVAVGDRVGVVAHPRGELRASVGTVRATELRSAFGGTSQVLLIDVEAQPGSSGGAVLDGAGRLVGIVAARDPSTGMSVAHPIGQLLDGSLVATPRC